MVEEPPLEREIPITANQPRQPRTEVGSSSSFSREISCRDHAQQLDFLRRQRAKLNMFRKPPRKGKPRKKVLTPRNGGGKPLGKVQDASKGAGATPPAPTSENEPACLPGPKGALPAETIPEGGLPLFETQSRHCRWPVNPEGTDYRCCGAPKLFPYPYCETHVGRAFNQHQLEARGVFVPTSKFQKLAPKKGPKKGFELGAWN
jgi:hypothetical protein